MADRAIQLLRQGYTIPAVAIELGLTWQEIKKLFNPDRRQNDDD